MSLIQSLLNRRISIIYTCLENNTNDDVVPNNKEVLFDDLEKSLLDSVTLNSKKSSSVNNNFSGPTTKSDKDGNKITTYKDSNGQILKKIKENKDGSIVDYAYTEGIISGAKKTDTNGDVTTYSYKNGIKTQAVKKTSLGSVVNYTYTDGILSEAKRTDANGDVTIYSYQDGAKDKAVKAA